jgi:hemolysin activation/secretion protein
MFKVLYRYTLACLAPVFVAVSPVHTAEVESAPAFDPPPHTVVRFAVTEVKVQGNTLLPEAELAKLVGHLPGSKWTLDDLNKAATSVQQAFRNAGYGGVVAFIPEQDLNGGNVVVRVIEGKLARIRISDNRRLDETNIRRSLPSLKEGTTPNVARIDRDIQLANENPVKELQVKLTAGAKPGEIDANIAVAEEKPLRFLFGLDNTGNPQSGEYRLSAGIQHANLWNRDHIGTLQYQTSPTEPDLVRIYSVGYRLPIYGHSSTIDAFYAHSTVDSGTTVTPAGPLQFTGTGDVAGLRYNRYLPRTGEYDHRLIFGVDWRHYDNECSVGTLGAAGCGNAGVSVASLPVSISYTGQVDNAKMSWGTSTSLAYNVGGSSQEVFEAARPGAKKGYTILRLSAFASHALPAGFGVHGRISGQYSPDALISGEQHGLGGATSVRGYRERELAGDHGFLVNLEGLGPDLGKAFKLQAASLRPLLFIDYGLATNHNGTPCHNTDSTCSLSSVGFGAHFAFGKWLSGRVDVGHTLEDGNQITSGRTRGHFALNLVF